MPLEGSRPPRRLTIADFRHIVDRVPCAFAISSLDDGRFIEVNQALLDLSGYAREEVIGRTALELGLWVRSDQREELLQRLNRHGVVRNFVAEFRDKTGRACHVLASMHLYEFAQRTCVVGFLLDATQLVQAREAAEESSRHLRIAESAADIGVWELDIATGRTYKSPTCDRIEGNAPGCSLQQEEWRARVHPDDLPRVDALWDTCVKTGRVFEVDFRFRRATGETVWLCSKGRSELGTDGTPIRLTGIVQDVTARKRVEEVLVKSEALYRGLFDAESDALFVIDATTQRFIDANAAASKLYGYSRRELLSLTVADISTQPEATREAIRNREKHVPVRYHRRRDGSVFPVEVAGSFFAVDGQSIHLAAIRDISVRRDAEKALRESELRFSTVFNQSPVPAVLSCAPGYEVVEVNDAWLDLFGFTRDQVIGRSTVALGVVRDSGWYPRLRRDAGGRVTVHNVEQVMYTHGGQAVDALVSMSALVIDGKRYALEHVQDITQRKRAERDLSKLSKAVEQSPESIAITDLHATIEYVNDAFLRNTGYSREEIIGRNPRLLQSGKTPRATYEAMWNALRRGSTWQGEFINRRKDGTEYVESVVMSPIRHSDGRITHFVAVKEDVTEKRRAAAEIERLVNHDPLTGLANRALLMDRMTQADSVAHRRGYVNALIMLDLDRFKNINDAHAHSAGDRLLVEVGSRMGALLHDGDTLARVGGDEFAVLLTNLAPDRTVAARRALMVAERIRQTLGSGIQISPFGDLDVTASLGITLCPEGKDDTPEEAQRRADTALHRAKDAGGDQIAFFEQEMGVAARQRFAVERDLRRAIPQGELRLYLQPQMRPDGVLRGAEVLVRWQHPERGLLQPSTFIPIAEESGLIVDLGHWVLAETCALLAREAAAGYPLRLAVNISPRQFREPDFVPLLEDVLAQTGADPTFLTLEVTEGLMIDNVDAVVTKMQQLTARGIHFSVDDFGTGYSSLSYLKRMPIHEIKIDKTFVQDAPQDPSDAALVDAILAVAKHLHLQVVAEGVENADQAEFLNERAEIVHQGYFYGKPAPADEWLRKWHGPKAVAHAPQLA